MSITLILLLIAIGIILLLIEIFIIPGTTIVGIVGGLIIAFSVWQGYILYGTRTGHLILIGSVIAVGLSLIGAFRSNTWKRLMLSTNIESRVNEYDATKLHIGDPGKAISRISPSGTALINDELYEVHTIGEFIDQETELIITKLEDNKIFVKRK